MTLAQAKQIAKEHGCTLRHQDGEYRVNFVGGSEATAYYTNDREDAVRTAIVMSKKRTEQRGIDYWEGI